MRLSPFLKPPVILRGLGVGVVIPPLLAISIHAPMHREEISVFLRFSKAVDHLAVLGDNHTGSAARRRPRSSVWSSPAFDEIVRPLRVAPVEI